MSFEKEGRDYIKDGILFCGVCHTPKQVKISLFGEEKIQYCACKCMSEKVSKDFAHVAEMTRESERLSAFPLREMGKWTFASDTGGSPRVMATAKKYVQNWKQMYQDNIGLLLFGDIGTGKTFAAACIANALLDMGVSVLMTDFSRIVNDMMDFDTGNNNDYIRNLNRYSLIIFDDFGVERETRTALQYVEDVIDSRYKAKMPVVITTNKSVEEMKKEKRIEYQRIYSRILGMTVAIQVTGNDLRKSEQATKILAAKKLLL